MVNNLSVAVRLASYFQAFNLGGLSIFVRNWRRFYQNINMVNCFLHRHSPARFHFTSKTQDGLPYSPELLLASCSTRRSTYADAELYPSCVKHEPQYSYPSSLRFNCIRYRLYNPTGCGSLSGERRAVGFSKNELESFLCAC